jgi:hypothetical protein
LVGLKVIAVGLFLVLIEYMHSPVSTNEKSIFGSSKEAVASVSPSALKEVTLTEDL